MRLLLLAIATGSICVFLPLTPAAHNDISSVSTGAAQKCSKYIIQQW
jgi:hypothetical protein